MLQRWRRVTIRGLMLVVAGAAGLSAVYRVSGAFGFLALSRIFGCGACSSHQLRRWTLARGNRRRAILDALCCFPRWNSLPWLGWASSAWAISAWPTSSSFRLSYFRLLLGGGVAWAGIGVTARAPIEVRSPRVAWSVCRPLTSPAARDDVHLFARADCVAGFPRRRSTGSRTAWPPGAASTGRSGRGCSL